MLRLFFLFLFFTSLSAQGKTFKNSYIRFSMPDRWHCDMKGKAWLCRSKISKSCQINPKNPACKKEIKTAREALIVLSAKEKSAVDTLENYQSHFGEAKPIKLKTGSTTQSKVNYSKLVSIKKNKWVDAMHLSSELPHYYTRYLATIKGKIAVLVTFTSHKKYYTQYSNQFFKSIKTLQLTASSLGQVKKNELGPGMLSRPIDIPDELFNQTEPFEGQGGGDGLSPILFALAMLMAGAGIFIWIKNRKSS